MSDIRRKGGKITAIACLLIVGIVGLVVLNPSEEQPLVDHLVGTGIGTAEDPLARMNWETQRMADPQTGELPNDIFAEERKFVHTLSAAHKKSQDWNQRGPYNIGGRTRAIAMDVDDPKILLIGSVTGGIYRSEDEGKTWEIATTPGKLLAVTDIIQDTRAGKHAHWYASTGEIMGNLTRYPGDGLYHSADGGKTWTGMHIENKPQDFRHINYSWRLVLDVTRNDSDVFYLASFGALLRSNDGGSTWNIALGGKTNSAYRTGADVVMTKSGILYATLSSNSPEKGGGIWRSENGLHWTNIQGDKFPYEHGRVVIAPYEGDENVVYFLGYTPRKGKKVSSHSGSEERNSFWRYEYLGGDGAGTNGLWEDRSDQIPDLRQTDGYVWGDFMSQGGYNLVCRVNPRNEDSIVIGGTNLFTSTDGFKTANNTTWVGGYRKTKDRLDALYTGLVYENHHPDNHNFLFHPKNINIGYSTNDGGIQRTEDLWRRDADVVWESLNRAYFTTQFYIIEMNQHPVKEHAMSDIILGGFQDNESQYIHASGESSEDWTRIACCDGSYASIFDKGEFSYVLASKQLGVMYLLKYAADGTLEGGNRADPTGGVNYLFINPFISNPITPEKIYLAAGSFIWRNEDISTLSLGNSDQTTDWNWERLPESNVRGKGTISALACSSIPANILYYGTSGGGLFKIENIEAENIEAVELSTDEDPLDGAGYISSISVDPKDANSVLVCFSNYNRKSIYHSTDGGSNWDHVSGNLEENEDGKGSGPGCNVVRILYNGDNEAVYFAGTTAGLFSTKSLEGASTVWQQEGADEIGNCSVRDIDFRAHDGLMVIGTHGCGSFSTQLEGVIGVSKINTNSQAIDVYPNPTSRQLTIKSDVQIQVLQLISIDGKKVLEKNNINSNLHQIDVVSFEKGHYILRIETSLGWEDKKIVID